MQVYRIKSARGLFTFRTYYILKIYRPTSINESGEPWQLHIVLQSIFITVQVVVSKSPFFVQLCKLIKRTVTCDIKPQKHFEHGNISLLSKPIVYDDWKSTNKIFAYLFRSDFRWLRSYVTVPTKLFIIKLAAQLKTDVYVRPCDIQRNNENLTCYPNIWSFETNFDLSYTLAKITK